MHPRLRNARPSTILRLAACSTIAACVFASVAIAQDARPATSAARPSAASENVPALLNDAAQNEDTQSDSRQSDQEPALVPADPRAVSPLPTSHQPLIGEPMDAPAHVQAHTTRIVENQDAGRVIQRSFTRLTNRDTTVLWKQRSHTLRDRIHEELDIELRFGRYPDDPARIQVLVLAARTIPASSRAPLNQAVPVNGLLLDCWQVDFNSICRDPDTGREIEWPQWANLDFSAWLTNGSVTTGSRWRRIIPDAQSTGWTDGHKSTTRAVLEVQRPITGSSDDKVWVEGKLETEGELHVYNEARRYPLFGQIKFDFDPVDKLVDHVSIQWRGELTIDGSLLGMPYHWARQTHVGLVVKSELR